MRFSIAFALALAVIAVWLVGCGGDEQPASDQPPSPVEQQVEPQADADPQPEPQAASAAAAPAPEQDDAEPVGQSEPSEQTEQPEPEEAETQPEPAQQVQQADADVDEAQDAPPESADEPAAVPTQFTLGGERTAALILPKDADLTQPRPLIVLLHGYGSYAAQADDYFRFSAEVDAGGYGLLLPDGTLDQIGNRFWHATPQCCDLFGTGVDDVGYLKSLIEEARQLAAFDGVAVVGHSNGGFMAYRLACEAVPDLIAIVSLAGGAFAEPDDCRAPAPLSVLQIHGDQDDIVLYEGGRLPTHPDPDRQPVPSAKDSVLRWTERAGCDIDEPTFLPDIDTDVAVPGRETSIVRFEKDCAEGTVMELWTIAGGGHIPLVWNTDFTPRILDWLDERYATAQAAAAAAAVEERTIGGERPARLLLPDTPSGESVPLVIALHGYQGEAAAFDWYFGLSERVSVYHFALLLPQGTADSRGNSFWNATDYCCNFDGNAIDDAAYLSALAAEAQELVEVSEIYVVGHSNGGYMAHRLACDGLNGLAGIVSLAGSSFGDPQRCADASPIAVLQIHGDADLDIPYAGTLKDDGVFAQRYPGAVEVTERWAARAGCDLAQAETLPNRDLEAVIEGHETSVQRYRAGCAAGVTVELWTITGGDHFPFFTDDWPDQLLTWLFDESRTS